MTAAGHLRAQAARVVAAVLDGRSLKAVLPGAEAPIADVRDRALLHAIVLAAVRGALRYRALLARLLDRRLPARARPAEAALIAALAQLEELQLPAHAVVAETVAAVRLLRLPNYAGMANAVLRRWLRERGAILPAVLADDQEAEHLHPHWLLEQLQRDWPDDWPAIVAANNAPAPMWLRVNRARNDPAEYLRELAAIGVEAVVHPGLPEALCLAEPLPVARLPGFADGRVSVQDAGAQYAARLLAAGPGMRVLDACAAPGGKTAHLLELQPALAELVALDLDDARLARVRESLDRLGLQATLRAGDAGTPETWWDGRPFDRILLDAPCSATGILRRQPDVRLHRRAGDIPVLAARQRRLLAALWPLLAPGGRLVYAVCSVLRAEGEAVLADFLSSHDDARAAPVPIADACPLAVGCQLLPRPTGGDGFYYALVDKSR